MDGAAAQDLIGTVRGNDRRAGRRYTLILRAGKLVCAAGEFLCVLRDVSAKGLKARLFHPLPECPSYLIEFGSGARFAVEPVWLRECQVGFRFAEGPIDVHALLAEARPFPKRHIRLRLGQALAVRLTGPEENIAARLNDISQHGAQLELAAGLALGRKIRIEADCLPILHARVRWRRGTVHGVVFQRGFRLDELAALAARLQLTGDHAALVSRRA
jgi:hypothetical protein